MRRDLSPAACSRCGVTVQLLASFCSACGHDLAELSHLPQDTELLESWSTDASAPIQTLAGHRSLLAVIKHNGWVDLWEPYQGRLLHNCQVSNPIENAGLCDNLLIVLSQQEVEIIHLTPALRQDICRFDRNARFQAHGPLASPLAIQQRHLAWCSGDQLSCYQAYPQGLRQNWHITVKGQVRDLAFNKQGLWCLQSQTLSLYCQDSGEKLSHLTLPAPVIKLWAEDEDIWICGNQGELYYCNGEQVQQNWSGYRHNCYAFSVSKNHVLQCCGQTLHLLNLQSNRQHTLQLPQPCVLPAILGLHWAVLQSYEGIIYHLSLEQETPQVIQSRRPFSSFEPLTVNPVIAGNKLILAGPEGQLAAWLL